MKLLATIAILSSLAFGDVNFCEKPFSKRDINGYLFTIKCVAGLTYISNKLGVTEINTNVVLVPTFQECKCQENGDIGVEPIYDENGNAEKYSYKF